MRFLVLALLLIFFASCEKEKNHLTGVGIYDVAISRDSLGESVYVVYLINTFSPNGDGINEVFGPIGYGFEKKFSFEVFDHNGRSIFYTTDPYKPWDGSFAGIVCPEGIYTYNFSFTDVDGVFRSYRGTVYLLK